MQASIITRLAEIKIWTVSTLESRSLKVFHPTCIAPCKMDCKALRLPKIVGWNRTSKLAQTRAFHPIAMLAVLDRRFPNLSSSLSGTYSDSTREGHSLDARVIMCTSWIAWVNDGLEEYYATKFHFMQKKQRTKIHGELVFSWSNTSHVHLWYFVALF